MCIFIVIFTLFTTANLFSASTPILFDLKASTTTLETKQSYNPEKQSPECAKYNGQEPAKMAYLQKMISPNTLHQTAIKGLTMMIGDNLRRSYLEKSRSTFNDYIRETAQDKKGKLLSKKRFFFLGLRLGYWLTKGVISNTIDLAKLSLQDAGLLKKLPPIISENIPPLKINFLEVEESFVMLIDSLLGVLIQKLLIGPKNNELLTTGLVGGFGGSVGSLLYSIYHLLFFSDRQCLIRTIKKFRTTPENFPTQSFLILKKAEILYDKQALDSESIALFCEQLRDLSKIDHALANSNPYLSPKAISDLLYSTTDTQHVTIT